MVLSLVPRVFAQVSNVLIRVRIGVAERKRKNESTIFRERSTDLKQFWVFSSLATTMRPFELYRSFDLQERSTT